MKFFAILLVILLSGNSLNSYTEARSICGDSVPTKPKVDAIRGDDSTANEKSLDVNEKSDATAVTDAVSSASTPTPTPTSTPTTTSTSTSPSTTEFSEVKQFFHAVQCTLEKAQPLVEEIEKEAKRFGETAKRFGESVISTITELVDKLVIHNVGANLGNGSVPPKPDADEIATVELVEKATEMAPVTSADAISNNNSAPITTNLEVTDDNLATNEIP